MSGTMINGATLAPRTPNSIEIPKLMKLIEFIGKVNEETYLVHNRTTKETLVGNFGDVFKTWYDWQDKGHVCILQKTDKAGKVLYSNPK